MKNKVPLNAIYVNYELKKVTELKILNINNDLSKITKMITYRINFLFLY